MGRLGGSILEGWVLIMGRSRLVKGKRKGPTNPGLQEYHREVSYEVPPLCVWTEDRGSGPHGWDT